MPGRLIYYGPGGPIIAVRCRTGCGEWRDARYFCRLFYPSLYKARINTWQATRRRSCRLRLAPVQQAKTPLPTTPDLTMRRAEDIKRAMEMRDYIVGRTNRRTANETDPQFDYSLFPEARFVLPDASRQEMQHLLKVSGIQHPRETHAGPSVRVTTRPADSGQEHAVPPRSAGTSRQATLGPRKRVPGADDNCVAFPGRRRRQAPPHPHPVGPDYTRWSHRTGDSTNNPPHLPVSRTASATTVRSME